MTDPESADAAAVPTEDQVRAAIMDVVDPEIGLPIVELGLVYEIKIDEEANVEVVYTLTSLGCPAGPIIDKEVNEALENVPGINSGRTTIVFQPPWSPEKMSDEAKAALGMF